MYKRSKNLYLDIIDCTSVDSAAFYQLNEDWQKDTYIKACRRRIATQYLKAAKEWLHSLVN